MIRFFKKLLIKIVAGIWLSGPRYWWSNLYRFLFEQKYKLVAMPRVQSIYDIEKVLRTISWSADSAYKLYDSISYPGTVYTTKKDDCDGFAILAVELLKQLQIYGYVYTYVPMDFASAHTICVFRYKGFVCAFSNSYLYETHAPNLKAFLDTFLRGNEPVVSDLRDEFFRRIKNI